MKNRTIKLLSLLLVICTAVSSFAITASALSWDGDSAGGGGGGSPAGPNGYALRYADIDKDLLGYRFSVVDKTGANKVSKVIDVFCDSYYGNREYSSAYKFDTKYNKKQLINYQNGNYTTSNNSTNCYKESEMGFATALPVPSEMQTWQNNVTNLTRLLSALGVGSIANLKNGDKILVEPIYDVRLESVYHALTPTELAIYGKHILGADSDGGTSSTSESWGFISSYTNRHYPNSLFTPDGQGLWAGVSAATKRLSFYNIINQGWGVGIAYTETKSEFSPSLSVKECRAYKGTSPTKTFHYGTSTGSSFANWTYVSGYPVSGDSIFFSVNFPKESENVYVRQTVWIDGVQVATRTGYSNNLEWYDVTASSKTVSASKSYYTVKARVDWIETSGTNKKVGAEKTFYIPVKPIVTREKVTAYNYSGEAQAYSGSSGSSGTLYFGQRVTFQYLYGAVTTWESANNVSAVANRWNGSSWAHIYTASTSGADVSASNVGLSKTKSYSKNSSIGSYRIPLPANSNTNSYKLKFDMKTAWSTDTAHTTESSTYYIPIVKADVELYEIKLIGSNGYYVDPQNLTVGEKVTIRYVYKNNTDCKVYVEGYNDDKSKISGVYSIPAGGTINVNGQTFTVPDKSEFTIWGGVYLEGAGIYNTSYESNGTNNTKTLTCNAKFPLTLTPITPNASYREGTDVITSYWLNNGSSKNYTPSSNITIRFRVYNASGTLIKTMTKTQAVVPGNDKNLVYFKWTVPTGLNYGQVTIKADILEAGEYYNLVSKTYSTIPYLKYTTPDTRYEEKAPSGFAVPSVPSAVSEFASWWEYRYEGGKFVKKTYGIGINNNGTNAITPDAKSTAEVVSGKWVMKSGYGFSVQAAIGTVNSSGYLTPDSTMYTSAQYAYITFPEYAYAYASGKCRTLEKSGSSWVLPVNGSYGRIHFTPLWFPDGNYTPVVTQSDMWTPAGMIKAARTTNTIVIKDSAYDDWYVGRK